MWRSCSEAEVMETRTAGSLLSSMRRGAGRGARGRRPPRRATRSIFRRAPLWGRRGPRRRRGARESSPSRSSSSSRREAPTERKPTCPAPPQLLHRLHLLLLRSAPLSTTRPPPPTWPSRPGPRPTTTRPRWPNHHHHHPSPPPRPSWPPSTTPTAAAAAEGTRRVSARQQRRSSHEVCQQQQQQHRARCRRPRRPSLAAIPWKMPRRRNPTTGGMMMRRCAHRRCARGLGAAYQSQCAWRPDGRPCRRGIACSR